MSWPVILMFIAIWFGHLYSAARKEAQEGIIAGNYDTSEEGRRLWAKFFVVRFYSQLLYDIWSIPNVTREFVKQVFVKRSFTYP